LLLLVLLQYLVSFFGWAMVMVLFFYFYFSTG
jgi:hypothetical protein